MKFTEQGQKTNETTLNVSDILLYSFHSNLEQMSFDFRPQLIGGVPPSPLPSSVNENQLGYPM